MVDRSNDLDNWIFELRACAETEAEFALRVALFCVGLAERSLGREERTSGVESSTLLQLH